MSELYQRCKGIIESNKKDNSTLLSVNDCQLVVDLHDLRKSKWISINDSLPAKSNSVRTQTVLLWNSGVCGSPYTLGYGVMDDGVNYPFNVEYWCYQQSGNTIHGAVTHWMSLPEPPKE